MRINEMWGMFYKDGRLCKHLVRITKLEVIEEANRIFGGKWPEFGEHYGHTIEKIVVLRAEDYEELLRRAEKWAG